MPPILCPSCSCDVEHCESCRAGVHFRQGHFTDDADVAVLRALVSIGTRSVAAALPHPDTDRMCVDTSDLSAMLEELKP